jgi:hypothetical protein
MAYPPLDPEEKKNCEHAESVALNWMETGKSLYDVNFVMVPGLRAVPGKPDGLYVGIGYKEVRRGKTNFKTTSFRLRSDPRKMTEDEAKNAKLLVEAIRAHADLMDKSIL